MSLRVLNDLRDLEKNAMEDVCVVKGVLNPQLCDEVTAAVEAWSRERAANEGRGENWWYRVSKEGSEFDSFMFWKIDSLRPPTLREKLQFVYGRLFDAHVFCGSVPSDATFDELVLHQGNQPVLEPLVFHYRPGTGKFQRHAHESGCQKTQVLINLTKRGRDYLGSETLIEEADGNVVKLGENFDQGDLFSFPYSLFHSVNPVLAPANPKAIGRMSILMPFHPRNTTAIRY
jgi:hypothetical protein